VAAWVRSPAPSSPWRCVLEAHGATVLFGLAGLFGKWVQAPALVVAGIRTAIAAACFAGLLALWPRLGAPPVMRVGTPGGAGSSGSSRKRSQHEASADRAGGRDRAALLAALAGAILGTHWWFFFEAVQAATVAVALLAYATAPGFVAILEPLLQRRAPAPAALAAAGLVMAGVALMVPRWSLGEATAVGAAWGVGAGLLFALLMLLNRHLVPRYGPVRLSFYLNVGASVVLLPALPSVWVPLRGADWALLAVLGVGFTVLAHTLFIASLRRLQAQTAAVISALEPVYGILGALLLLGEVPAARAILGGAVIVGTVMWVSAQTSRRTGA
jgi:drug/metabolite transporter (DMT)-like permease